MTAACQVSAQLDARTCPFCGGSNLTHDWSDTNCRFQRCTECGCTGPGSTTQAEAITAWNNRAAASHEAVEAIVCTLLQYIDDLRYPPSADSAERRIAAAERAIKQVQEHLA